MYSLSKVHGLVKVAHLRLIFKAHDPSVKNLSKSFLKKWFKSKEKAQQRLSCNTELSERLKKGIWEGNTSETLSHISANFAGLLLNEKSASIQTKPIKVVKIRPGIYTHFGLENNLQILLLNLRKGNLLFENEIQISVFIDELPLSTFTQEGLWVILGSITNFSRQIFLIGAYRGCSKPENANSFLSEFVQEAKLLCKSGIIVNDVKYNLKIKRLICDAPAKAFILNIKTFQSYSSCTKCSIVGIYKNKKMCFFGIGNLRKNEDFESEDMYLKSKSLLLEIPDFGVVSHVVLEYMHLVCLGVVRKLFSIWLGNDRYWCDKNLAFERVTNLSYSYPLELKKEPKSLKIFTRWGATEFREFLLYYGPAVLKNTLHHEFYQHFLLLHVACRLLCIDASPDNIDISRPLLNSFVDNYKGLYNEQVTHNIHGLYHLADECSNHGNLDSFSAFPFEQFLITLRNALKRTRLQHYRTTEFHLKQAYFNIFYKNLERLTLKKVRNKAFRLHPSLNSEKSFHRDQIIVNDFYIKPSSLGDKYVILKNGKLVQVTDIFEHPREKTLFISGKEFDSVSSFYCKNYCYLPLASYSVTNSFSLNSWSIDAVDKKCMLIPLGNNRSVMVSLLSQHF